MWKHSCSRACSRLHVLIAFFKYLHNNDVSSYPLPILYKHITIVFGCKLFSAVFLFSSSPDHFSKSCHRPNISPFNMDNGINIYIWIPTENPINLFNDRGLTKANKCICASLFYIQPLHNPFSFIFLSIRWILARLCAKWKL